MQKSITGIITDCSVALNQQALNNNNVANTPNIVPVNVKLNYMTAAATTTTWWNKDNNSRNNNAILLEHNLIDVYNSVVPVTTDNMLNQSFYSFIHSHSYINKLFVIDKTNIADEILTQLGTFNHYKEYFSLINDDSVTNIYLFNVRKNGAYITQDEEILSKFTNPNHIYYWIWYLGHNFYINLNQIFIHNEYGIIKFNIKDFNGSYKCTGHVQRMQKKKFTIAQADELFFNISDLGTFPQHPHCVDVANTLKEKVKKYSHYLLAKLLLQKL